MQNSNSNNHPRDLPHVAILMATYNGERFLREQLDSFAAQTHENWSLWVSDDGSTDDTLAIIRAFAAENPAHQVTVFDGPKLGFAQNFFSLMMREEISADYYALSDQDDIWLPKKLSCAVEKLIESGAALYGGRTISITEDGQHLAKSPLFKRPPSLQNALVQSIAGGNTMVLSKDGMKLVQAGGAVDVISHDWWLYIWLTYNGEQVIYDPEPYLHYRQHGKNLVGSNQGLSAKWNRLKRLMRSDFQNWNDQHLSALATRLGEDNSREQQLVLKFRQLRKMRGITATFLLKNLHLYRQSHEGQLALYFASFIGKL